MLLEVHGLRKSFGSGSRRLDVLKGVDLTLNQGELVALMGPSGSGKSTLLNIVGGLLAGDEGNIALDGRNYGLKGPASVVDVRREKVGWIFQDFHLIDGLTALDNVAFALEVAGMGGKEAEQRAVEALERVGLADRMGHVPEQLSGGQQQRVAIARALVTEPTVIFADEPTGNLDSASGQEILDLLRRAVDERGRTVVMVTHDPRAATIADRVVLLSDGRVVLDRSGMDADEIYDAVRTLDPA